MRCDAEVTETPDGKFTAWGRILSGKIGPNEFDRIFPGHPHPYTTFSGAAEAVTAWALEHGADEVWINGEMQERDP